MARSPSNGCARRKIFRAWYSGNKWRFSGWAVQTYFASNGVSHCCSNSVLENARTMRRHSWAITAIGLGVLLPW